MACVAVQPRSPCQRHESWVKSGNGCATPKNQRLVRPMSPTSKTIAKPNPDLSDSALLVVLIPDYKTLQVGPNRTHEVWHA